MFTDSTLVIMKSLEEKNCLFGGMAVPSWHSNGNSSSDPAELCSWLFKLESQGD